ncbi:hypothetical protein JTB14_033322 [Gonioctena quinquepunctata]|nr:hypothetical protein JTB14_033322 [Gonioctena quinquepunctata]
MGDFEKDRARLLKLFDEVETDDELLDDENPSDPNTESSSEEHLSSDEQEIDMSPFSLGKDKVTRWSKEQNRIQVKTRSQNIISHLPGPKNAAKNCKSALECFHLFISEDIVREIVECTTTNVQETANQLII